MNRTILIIDDDADMCVLLQRFLSRKGYEVDTAHSGAKGLEKFKQQPVDMVLCDFRLGDKRDGKDILVAIKELAPKTIVLIITGYSDIKVAVDVIKAGAYDYITKPLIPDEVLNVIERAFAQNETSSNKPNGSSTNDISTSNAASFPMPEFLVGEAPATQNLYSKIALVAPTSYSIILHGESGTGKEVVAKTIHEMSNRNKKPFVAMDCGTLSKELAGSELFGHVKGSFTGAINDKEGHFEMANGGTLFLDEVANLSPETQASLLRVIQERKLKRIGGTREINIDVRIIVATNENLQEAYRTGRFREDLFHRFNEFSITLPPLRERREDIPLFARFFLQKTNVELNKSITGFTDEVIGLFVRYSWPGNLREFRNVIRRCVLLTQEGEISASTLPAEITGAESGETETISPIPAYNKGFPSKQGLKDAAAKAEYDTIMQVLKEVNFNKTKAASLLNIDRKTLYNKIRGFEDSQSASEISQ